MVRTATLSMLVIALIASVATAAGERTALDDMLGKVRLMPGRSHRSLTVFPLVLPDAEKAEPLAVKTLRDAVKAHEITLAEPLKPTRRYNVLVTSNSEQAVLLPAGTILIGGRLDRMIPKDRIVEPGMQIQIATLPAEYRRDARHGKGVSLEFRVSKHIAPHVLRQGGVFTPRLELVPSFISRFLDFRPDGDRRHSLASVSAAPALTAPLKADLAVLANVPRIYEGRVVGWITMIGGKVHGLDIFGSNELAAAHYPAMLRAHVFTAAAMTLRADAMKIPMPSRMALLDPEHHRPAVESFLARMRESDWASRVDGSLRLRRGRSRGLALVGTDGVIHVAAVADLAFLQRLHDAPLPPPPSYVTAHSFGVLDRATVIEGRRNTVYEKRLLERMRERRQSR